MKNLTQLIGIHYFFLALLSACNTHQQLNCDDKNQCLRQAASEGNKVQIEQLLERGANPNACCGQHLLSPLTEAASEGHVRVVASLLKNGNADIDGRDRHGLTPLISAASADSSLNEMGRADVARYILLSGGDPNLVDNMRRTALHWAIITNSGLEARVARALLEDERTAPNLPDSRGWAPLHYAAQWGSIKELKLLLNDGRIRPNLGARVSRTETWPPIRCAIEQNKKAAVFHFLMDERITIDEGTYGQVGRLSGSLREMMERRYNSQRIGNELPTGAEVLLP